ncbi:sigma-70 family RNA polymerase sigma factor [Planctomycetaceae bacterium SH139]
MSNSPGSRIASKNVQDRIGRFRPFLRLLAGMQLDPLLQRRVDPSDVVQQTLLNAHRAASQFRGETDEELAGWLKQILINELARHWRDNLRAKRDVSQEVSIGQAIDASSLRLAKLFSEDNANAESTAASNERALLIGKAMETLPNLQREAIELHYWHQHSLQEIADLQQKSKSAVAGAIRRGLKTLRGQLAGLT